MGRRNMIVCDARAGESVLRVRRATRSDGKGMGDIIVISCFVATSQLKSASLRREYAAGERVASCFPAGLAEGANCMLQGTAAHGFDGSPLD